MYIMPEINIMDIFFVYVFYQDHNYGIVEYISVDFGGNFLKLNSPYGSQAKKILKCYLKFIHYLR